MPQNFVVIVNDNGQPNLQDQKSFRVTVNPSLRISQEPVDQAIPLDGTASFSVTAIGLSPITYQWFREGQPLPGQTNSTLVVTNAKPAVAGNYQLIARRGSEEVRSRAARLTVVTEPNLGVVSVRPDPARGVVNLVLIGPAGGEYGLFQTSDFVRWTLITRLTMTGRPVEYVDASPATGRFRFYRLSSLVP